MEFYGSSATSSWRFAAELKGIDLRLMLRIGEEINDIIYEMNWIFI
jgi:hypothetical protein